MFFPWLVLVGSDVSVASVVSRFVLASCDTEMCPEELCLSERVKESEFVEHHGVCMCVFFGSQSSVPPAKREPSLERVG